MVKISIRANFYINATGLTATAPNPAWAAAAPGLHDPSALPVHANVKLTQSADFMGPSATTLNPLPGSV